jgi:hypothetical protein
MTQKTMEDDVDIVEDDLERMEDDQNYLGDEINSPWASSAQILHWLLSM